MPKVLDIQDTIESMSDHIVIAGFGRVGSTVAKKLSDAGMSYIAVDLDPRRITLAQARNQPLYYGDATNPEILAALHVERARAVVVAVDDPKAALHLVALLSYIFPALKVYGPRSGREPCATTPRGGCGHRRAGADRNRRADRRRDSLILSVTHLVKIHAVSWPWTGAVFTQR